MTSFKNIYTLIYSVPHYRRKCCSDGDWECDCPDSSQEKYLSPTETSGNEPAYEQWKDSDAGAKNGQ